MSSPAIAVPLPHATRQQVFNALFALLKQVPAPAGGKWQTFTQHLKSWDDYTSDQQPVLTLYRLPQIAEQKTFSVTKWHWKAAVFVYYRIDSIQCTTGSVYPEELVDDLIDAIETVFLTPLNNRLTLGGLVYHCWIDGPITFDSGIIDNQAVIVVPISILI